MFATAVAVGCTKREVRKVLQQQGGGGLEPNKKTAKKNGRLTILFPLVCTVHKSTMPPTPPSPELIVLVDFKAIYPWVPPSIFASFPGVQVAHFLSFEEICQYPRVPQGKVANPWGTLGYYFPGVGPREIKMGYI